MQQQETKAGERPSPVKERACLYCFGTWRMGQKHELLAEMQQHIEIQSLRDHGTATSHTETDCASFSEFKAVFGRKCIAAE